MKARVERWEGERVEEKLPRFLSSHHPSLAHRFFFFFFFLMLPSLLEYPAAASAKEDLIIQRGRYFSGRSPRIRH